MTTTLKLSCYPAVGAVLLASASASAINLASFSFSDLNASYTVTSPTNGTFGAVSSNTGVLQTAGDVTRLTGAGGTALFGPGLASSVVNFNISVSSINTVSNTALGSGTFAIMDADGDILGGTITGMFSMMFGGGGTFFNGSLSNVTLVDGGVVDSTFDGTSGGSFIRDLGPPGIYNGYVINLFINPTGTFFQSAFADVSSQASAVIVPAPAALATLGLGVMVLGGRRRR